MARTCLFSAPGLRFLTLLALIGFGVASWAGETVLHSFNNAPNGAAPTASLVADSAGNLYGTTSKGGTYGEGTVFKLSRDAKGKWMQTVLLSFGSSSDGGFPTSALTMDSAGNLYGTTDYVVFELSPSANGTWTENILYTFQGNTDAAGPASPLIFDSSGNLFGTTYYGGANSVGTVFELSPNGQGSWSETVLYSFADELDGAYPAGGLTFDKAGNLYGTTALGGDTNCNSFYGGVIGCGAIFQLAKNANGTWTENTLHAFNFADGVFPYGSLVSDGAGNFYGTTNGGPNYSCLEWGCGTVYRLSLNSGKWTLTTIYQFAGGTDGANPVAGLILDAKGNLYGTTEFGGESAACSNASCGIVFELSPTGNSFWQEKILHRFSYPGGFGLLPMASLLLDQSGNLYGTTEAGGAACVAQGCGSVFKLTPTSNGPWSATDLTVFPGVGDGLQPEAGLVADSSGNLYGTTSQGGSTGGGAVYELSPQKAGGWSEKVIYAFPGGSAGAGPTGELIFDAQGNLYGTTDFGGDPNCNCGVAFELSPTAKGSWLETVLYTFLGGTNDGAYPGAALVFDTAGNLYGTTSGGGGGYCNNYGCGTAFEFSPGSNGQWTETILHHFTAVPDGLSPSSALTIAPDGSLYGTTPYGGEADYGVVFRLSPTGAGAWIESILYAFQGGSDAAAPNGVVFGSDGSLYGTSYSGGDTAACSPYGCGTVFHLSRSGSGWAENVIYTFDPKRVSGEGIYPSAPPVLDVAGNLYGSTYYGGLANCPGAPCGTVFKLTPSQSGHWTETILTQFDYVDGSNSRAPLILDSQGNLFGTTYYGGDQDYGVVFEITPDDSAIMSQTHVARPPFTRPNSSRSLPHVTDLTRAAARGKAEK